MSSLNPPTGINRYQSCYKYIRRYHSARYIKPAPKHFCYIGHVVVNKILTLCFVPNGGDISFTVHFRGMFDDSLRYHHRRWEAFILP
jgi:hypothetical protein